MLQSQCDVCYEYLELCSFRFSNKCGHGICLTCLERYFRGSRQSLPCPKCRTPFRSADSHQIFLDTFITPSTENNDDGAALKQVAEAGVRIKNKEVNDVAQSLEEVKEDIEDLMKSGESKQSARGLHIMLSAFAKFIGRIVPVVARATAQGAELVVAKKLLEERDAQRRAMKREIAEANRLASEALDTADQAKTELLKASEEHRKTFRDAQALHDSQMAIKSKELGDLRKTLLGHKEKAVKQQKKIIELREEVKRQEGIISDLQYSAATQMKSHAVASERYAGASSSANEQMSQSDSFDVYLDEDYDMGEELSSMEDAKPRSPALDRTSQNPFSVRKDKSDHEPPPRAIRKDQGQSKPLFQTDWNLKPQNLNKTVMSQSAVAESDFPLKLDSRGRVKGVVQTGPVSTRRVKSYF